MPRSTLDFNDMATSNRVRMNQNPAKIQAAGETWIGNYTKGYKAGYEAIHMIPQRPGVLECDRCLVGLLHRFIVGMFGLEV